MKLLALAGLVATLALGAGALAGTAGEPVAGRAVFARCAACHDVKPGANRLGPSLAGLFGRRAGSVAGFNYSPAMRGSRIVWTRATLDAYLAGPARNIPGNRMIFAGIANPAERANLLAYLAQATRPQRASN